MKTKKSKKHFEQIEKFEQILNEIFGEGTTRQMWETDTHNSTLYGYFVRGEIVVVQCFHDGGGIFPYVMIRGAQWDNISDGLKKQFKKELAPAES